MRLYLSLLMVGLLACGDDDTSTDGDLDAGSDLGAVDVDAGPPEVGDSEIFTRLEAVSEGIALGETADGVVLYVGVRDQGIVTVDPEGTVALFAEVPGVLGIAVRADGTLVACGKVDDTEGAAGAIWAVDAAGAPSILIDQTAAGDPYSLTNYIAVAPDDSLVFTDSDAETIHRADADGGNVTLIDDTISYPNGLAFTPDGTQLLVASWDGDAVHAAPFDASTGTYGAFELWLDGVAAVDGIVTTTEGAMFLITSGDGVLRTPAGASEVQEVVSNRAILLPANGVMGQGTFGSEWLYIAALGSPRVHRIFVGETGPALPIR